MFREETCLNDKKKYIYVAGRQKLKCEMEQKIFPQTKTTKENLRKALWNV